MAADGMVKYDIKKTIDLWGETKGKVPPKWLVARAGKWKLAPKMIVNRTIEVKQKKWKKKVIEDGVYAIARADLQIFATRLATHEKKINDARTAVSKERAKAKFKANDPDEGPDEKKALDAALKDINAMYKKYATKIMDKIEDALDEVEGDVDDNKQSLDAGKAAFKEFAKMDTDAIFEAPLNNVGAVFDALTKALGKSGTDPKSAFDAASAAIKKVEASYEKTAKNVGKTAKMFIQQAGKIAKDREADEELKKFGKELEKGSKNHFSALVKNIDGFGAALDGLVNFFAKQDVTAADVAKRKAHFDSKEGAKLSSAKNAIKVMNDLSKQFTKFEKKLK